MEGFVGLGSNLGDRRRHLARALERLARRGLEPLEWSGVWETAPLDGAGPQRFLNMVARVETGLGPWDALDALLDVEREIGRVRRERNEPRIVDLDLLLLGELNIEDPRLVLPHPRMWRRRFVLAPLSQIAPHLRDPATGRTVIEQDRELRSVQPDVREIGALDPAVCPLL